MLDVLLGEESRRKAEAEVAARIGDWARVATEARRLVRVYDVILSDGRIGLDSLPRWKALRRKWYEIGEQAAAKSKGETGIPLKREATPAPASNKRVENAGNSTDTGKGEPLRLSDVKGLSDAKQVVMDALVNPVLHPEIYKVLKMKTGKGLLLYGPPGTGKTMFARAIAGELGIPFIYKKVGELKDKYVGESEKSIARLFEEAATHEKCLIFLDECEGILRKRGNQKICLVEAFLAELDGFSTNRSAQVFTLLATNRPWLIDSAVLRSGRISAAVYVGLPNAEARRFIIEAALKDLPLADDVDINEMTVRTEGFSGAELHHGDGGGVCDEMKRFAHRRWEAARNGLPADDPAWHDTHDVRIIRDDFERAMKKVVPVSVSDPEIVRKNKAFSFGRASSLSGEEHDEWNE